MKPRTIQEQIADLEEQIANLQRNLDELRRHETAEECGEESDDYMQPALRDRGFQTFLLRRQLEHGGEGRAHHAR